MIEGLFSASKELFFPVVVIIGAIAGLLTLVARLVIGEPAQKWSVFVVAFGFLGGVSGLIAGVSREPIIGAYLTGLLTINSALLGYLFSREALASMRPVVPWAMMALVLSALAGLTIGSVYRQQFEIYEKDYKKWLLEYEHVYLPVLKEERLTKLREASLAASSASRVSGK